MKDGFIKVAAGTVDVVVADVQYNTEQILARMREADAAGVNLLTLPELWYLDWSRLEDAEEIFIGWSGFEDDD